VCSTHVTRTPLATTSPLRSATIIPADKGAWSLACGPFVGARPLNLYFKHPNARKARTGVENIDVPHDQSSGSSSDLRSCVLRPRTAGDDIRIVGIYAQRRVENTTLTVERYRLEHAAMDADRRSEQWVAVEKDRIVGVGNVQLAWWTGDPYAYTLDICVDAADERKGVGTRLHDHLLTRLQARKATRLLDWLRADASSGRRFAERHGFHETGHVVEEYRLVLSSARDTDYPGVEERLRKGGLLITTLASLDAESEPLLRSLQRLWTEGGDDAGPSDQTALDDSFTSWRRQVLQSPGLSSETHWVALEGGRPVGMAFLKKLSADEYENDYMVVAAAQRGRGIATALKLRAISWARSHGVDSFYTSSEIGNAPMIAINTRLGYEPVGRRLEVARDLA